MKLSELYKKPIGRAVNPAVSATKFDPETEKIEIEEYVFTDEIINGLYRILDAIKNNKPYDHVGIWIDGYYGSGKSHFLKYLDYCITPRTQKKALERLLEAVKSIDPLDENHNISCDYEAMLSIANWRRKHSCMYSGMSSTASVVSISSTSLWLRTSKSLCRKKACSSSSRSVLLRRVATGMIQAKQPI